MTDATQLERLLKAIKPVCDFHAEQKREGSSLLYLPMTGRDLKELRSAYEPFRDRNKA